jgi:thiol-disulfide isomerase/thioredoxin
MDLERDQFVVDYNAARTSEDKLIAASRLVGFTARVVPNSKLDDPLFFREALAKARREKKPIVLDFTASWCEPCQKMLHTTFPHPKVAPLLERSIFVKVDADEYPALAKRFGAVALPDIRFLSPQEEELRRFQDFQGPDAFAEALSGLLKEVAAGSLGDSLVVLSDNESEVKERFNRDVGNIRLILVLSPT